MQKAASTRAVASVYRRIFGSNKDPFYRTLVELKLLTFNNTYANCSKSVDGEGEEKGERERERGRRTKRHDI